MAEGTEQTPPAPPAPPTQLITPTPPTQLPPQTQLLPQAPQAPRYKVHSSFIWLGGIQLTISILVLLVVFGFSTIAAIISDIGSSIRYNTMALVLIIVGAILLILVIMGLVFLYRYFSYKHLWFELDEDEFSLYSGILSKKRVHVPYQRVQSVNQRATLIQRIAGVCTVHIDTAGGAQNKAVVVPYLRKTDAEWLRTQLFQLKYELSLAHANRAAGAGAAGTGAAGVGAIGVAGAAGAAVPPPPSGLPILPTAAPGVQGYPMQTPPGATGGGNVLDTPAGIMQDMRGVFGGTGFDLGAVSYSYGLSNKELVFTGVSNSSSFAALVFAILAALFGVGYTIVQTVLGGLIGNEAAQLVTGVARDAFGPFLLGSSILIIFIIWLLSVGGTCLNYGGFTARRRGSRIEVEHGILQHRFDGVDIDRVQSVIIKQSFIRRLIGYCEISLGKINALTDAQKQNNNQAGVAQSGLVVHPFVKMSRVPEILAGLVPEYADVPVDIIKLPKVALRRAILRRCIIRGGGFWTAVIVAITQICLNLFMQDMADELVIINFVALALYVICVLIAIFEGIAAVLWYRQSGFAYNQHFMQIANGGFSFESVSFPRKKIQFGFVRTNPFQRQSKVMTVYARTAAGMGGTSLSLVDAHEDDALTWFDWLIPQRKPADDYPSN